MHIQLNIQSSDPDFSDILVAELSELNFEGFVEENKGELQAFITEDQYDSEITEETLGRYKEAFGLSWKLSHVKDENWNAIWESNFEPVEIAGKLRIRALFHPHDGSYPLEIIIQPKMSFGTGHHATTSLVCSLMLGLDLKDKSVFDFGTGTGILAILAHKLGAAPVMAVDNDPICVENAAENLALNSIENIRVAIGDSPLSLGNQVDIIIGNITRNVILQHLSDIAGKLKKNGLFLASGFYENDLDMLKSEAYSLGLHLESFELKDGWCVASFKKIG